MSSQLRYRGLCYDPGSHERASDRPVAHTYRGQRYFSPLRHPMAAAEIKEELRYRGQTYLSHRSRSAGASKEAEFVGEP
jgi:hypothetical protein